jgi:sugar (pentulose or hexulose) kinase
MTVKTFLGIDVGTQGLSVVATDIDLKVLATATGEYQMLPGLGDGCYEQRPDDWELALRSAMTGLRNQMADDFQVAAIGISGQMHGEVLVGADGKALGAARLWCDGRNEQEGQQLTDAFNVKMPKRITAARWLWTIRNQTEKARRTFQLTTPAGWLSYRLTGMTGLGIGDASGMFPIDQSTRDYDLELLARFDSMHRDPDVRSLRDLLPTVRLAGQDAGRLDAHGAEWLGLPRGIPVAPAEGDQPAALAGSLIGDAGLVSVSFGTSVCANSIGDKRFEGVSVAVDHFCAVDGKPINMVWLRNGTTFMNGVLELLGGAASNERRPIFETVMPMVIQSPADCGGILALPFLEDEPGLEIGRGGTAGFFGMTPDNGTPGNVTKAALLATMFNLRLGAEVLDRQGFPRTEIILSGGLTKTPQLGQILADVFRTPVTLLESAQEGTAWGAALLAKYRHQCIAKTTCDWSSFLRTQSAGDKMRFVPNLADARQYDAVYTRYMQLIRAHSTLARAFLPSTETRD